ncbi:hypothetical protein [Micromonospora sp. DT233]|uniref:hypothetical protein n=1 Tax=Micromonospora sp. DT233 TaxID=3393432 RepID=UPI003CF89848
MNSIPALLATLHECHRQLAEYGARLHRDYDFGTEGAHFTHLDTEKSRTDDSISVEVRSALQTNPESFLTNDYYIALRLRISPREARVESSVAAYLDVAVNAYGPDSHVLHERRTDCRDLDEALRAASEHVSALQHIEDYPKTLGLPLRRQGLAPTARPVPAHAPLAADRVGMERAGGEGSTGLAEATAFLTALHQCAFDLDECHLYVEFSDTSKPVTGRTWMQTRRSGDSYCVEVTSRREIGLQPGPDPDVDFGPVRNASCLRMSLWFSPRDACVESSVEAHLDEAVGPHAPGIHVFHDNRSENLDFEGALRAAREHLLAIYPVNYPPTLRIDLR